MSEQNLLFLPQLTHNMTADHNVIWQAILGKWQYFVPNWSKNKFEQEEEEKLVKFQ